MKEGGATASGNERMRQGGVAGRGPEGVGCYESKGWRVKDRQAGRQVGAGQLVASEQSQNNE